MMLLQFCCKAALKKKIVFCCCSAEVSSVLSIFLFITISYRLITCTHILVASLTMLWHHWFWHTDHCKMACADLSRAVECGIYIFIYGCSWLSSKGDWLRLHNFYGFMDWPKKCIMTQHGLSFADKCFVRSWTLLSVKAYPICYLSPVRCVFKAPSPSS